MKLKEKRWERGIGVSECTRMVGFRVMTMLSVMIGDWVGEAPPHLASTAVAFLQVNNTPATHPLIPRRLFVVPDYDNKEHVLESVALAELDPYGAIADRAEQLANEALWADEASTDSAPDDRDDDDVSP